MDNIAVMERGETPTGKGRIEAVIFCKVNWFMSIKNLHISDFGEIIHFGGVSELIDGLASQFKSCSVAVKWVDGITGMQKIYLVCVDEDGVIRSSHKNEVVDLNVIIK